MPDFTAELWDGTHLIARVRVSMDEVPAVERLNWRGSFQTDDNPAGVAWVFSEGTATLRLADGREGVIVLKVWMPGPPAHVEFEGWSRP